MSLICSQNHWKTSVKKTFLAKLLATSQQVFFKDFDFLSEYLSMAVLELFKFWQRYSKVFSKVAAIYRSNKGFLHNISSLQMFFVFMQVLKNLSHSLRCSEKYVLEIGVLQFFRFTCHQDLWKIYVKKSVLIMLQSCYLWNSPCVFLLLSCISSCIFGWVPLYKNYFRKNFFQCIFW